jgi:hypothetical protein
MRKTAFTILSALLIAGSAVQVATASEHHVRGGRSHHHRWDRAYDQLREPGFSIPQMRDGYNEGGGASKPADGTKSCDRLWCYSD